MVPPLADQAADPRDGGFAHPPTAIDICLTDSCNLRCDYCPIWGSKGIAPQPTMMETGSMLCLLDELSGFSPSIRLIGGEVMLHPDWPLIVAEARARGMWTAMVANGTLIEDQIDMLLSSGLLAIGISLDGTHSSNDFHRGAGMAARVRRAVARLTEAKRRNGSELPWIEIYTTIHRANCGRLEAFAGELSTWGIRKLRIQHLIWCSSSQFADSQRQLFERDPTWVLFGDERAHVRDGPSGVDPVLLEEQLTALRTTALPFEIEILPDLDPEDLGPYHRDVEYQRRPPTPCRLLDSCAYVGPEGVLRPCLHIDMGNVFDRGFLELWNGQSFRAFRRFIRRRGRLPICQRCPD